MLKDLICKIEIQDTVEEIPHKIHETKDQIFITVDFPGLRLFSLEKTIFAFVCMLNRAPELNLFLQVWSLFDNRKEKFKN